MENVTMRTKERRKTAFMKHNMSNPNNDKSPSNSIADTNNLEDATINEVKEPGVQTFASVLHKKQVKNVVKITELRNEEVVEGAAIALPLDAVDKVSSRLSNTLYGYFIRKRLAFPLVETYVKNTWAKYGLKRVQLHNDFFLFQFETKEGMESVLENGPWLIRLVPLILNVWTHNTDLKKAEIKSALVWVKLHHVPIVAYFESSWGRSTYARALVEVSADKELMESIVIAIPKWKDKGHSLATIEIEYEWKPPRCSTCMVFDHVTEKCPKIPRVEQPAMGDDDGFIEMKKKKIKPKETDEDGGAWDDNVSNATLNVSDNEVDEEMIMEERQGAAAMAANSGGKHSC
ncbi:zinc knuckle CX2CX4HX4C containing protein [Tanacetum coccineum]